RHRHSRARPRPSIPAVLPARCRPDATTRWHRTRTVHLPRSRRAPRWTYRGRVDAGEGIDVYASGAARPGVVVIPSGASAASEVEGSGTPDKTHAPAPGSSTPSLRSVARNDRKKLRVARDDTGSPLHFLAYESSH